jgi:hypothetical protein
MDKEKQINGNSEYMLFSQRQKLADEYEQWVNTPLKDGSKIKDCALSVITFMQWKGYRKLPEDARVFIPTDDKYVLLSREEKQEYENLVKLLIYDKPIKSRVYEFIKDTKEQASKETVEKIYKDIRLFLDDKTLAIITRYFKEILGVEIKE